MKRVTHAIPDEQGKYKDAHGNRYSLQSGMYTLEQISEMSQVWTPGAEGDEIVLGEQASPQYAVGVCYWNIVQAVRWLGLTNT